MHDVHGGPVVETIDTVHTLTIGYTPNNEDLSTMTEVLGILEDHFIETGDWLPVVRFAALRRRLINVKG